MDLAFIDNLASQNSGVNYFLVALDIFRDFKNEKKSMPKTLCKLPKKLILQEKIILESFEVIIEPKLRSFQ